MDGAEHVASGRTDTPVRDDAALIAESLQAPERFGVLFDRHASSIYRYAARRLGPDKADDIVADTFLTAFRVRHRYDTDYPDAGPWLYGIATRLIGRHRRDEVRFFRAIGRTGLDPAAATVDDPVAEMATDRAAASAVRRQLADAIAGLSLVHRDVLLLTASGLAYQEVAGALGIPVGTVSSRLVRARAKVRVSLGGTDPTKPKRGAVR